MADAPRRANMSAELRLQLERLGENLLTQMVGAGEHSSKGHELDKLLRENRPEILEWLQEQAAARKLHEEKTYQMLCWTLGAAIVGVIVGIAGVLVTWLH